jgi:two-component SAPR family response regulator
MLGKYVLLLIGFLFTSITGYEQSHGLQFASHEVVPEKRTSLHLTSAEPLCLEDDTEITFDFNFTPNHETYFGYIARIITSNKQNIDVVYNQRLLNFNFVIGENYSFVFKIDSASLFGEWNRCSIRFNKKKQEVYFYLNDKMVCSHKLSFSKTTCCKIYFGTNDFDGFKTIDIPPMRLKDIKITQAKKQKYFYPLSETKGNQAEDIIEKNKAAVKNPVWVKRKHQNWDRIHSIETKATASVAFDKKNEILYLVSVDSLYSISLKDDQITGIKLSQGRGYLPPGNQSVFDPSANRLYNFYIDEKKVSTYIPGTASWTDNFTYTALTEYWHANKFVSSFDSSLYVFGGYGQLQYKNLVQRYQFSTKKWELLKPQGDMFMPRYLAALGTNATTDTAFIIGGYGSNTGDQTINPKYNYDLLSFSVKSNSFKRLYQLNEPGKQFCFANSLIIDPATRDFYSLIYPIDRFNSTLQLIKFSVNSPQYQLVGDTIPYPFHDIKSFADLFYSPVSKKLVAVTLFSSKDSTTSIKVYTLDFPPNALVAGSEAAHKNQDWLLYILVFAGILLVGGLAFLQYKRKLKQVVITAQPTAEVAITEVKLPPQVLKKQTPEPEVLLEATPISHIFLFGQFEVIDKNGTDITRHFTPLVKELFLLLLIYSYKDGRGISSETLFEILWSDKSTKDARNNFSVNIVKLKAILDKVGEYQISKESGRWKFEILNDSIETDYRQVVKLASEKPVIGKAHVQALLNIILRGAFLREVQYNWLADIKSEISGFLIEVLLKYIASADIQNDPEFIVKLANCIFFFDQLNEEALEYKCRCLVMLGRHGMAKDAYVKFAKEYKESYGQEFDKTFADVIAH